MSKKRVPPGLAAAAREAWCYLTQSADPMPVGVALDWVRERAGTDDLRAVKKALYGAAADAVLAARPSTVDGNSFSSELRRGKFDQAENSAELFPRFYGDPDHDLSRDPEAPAWLAWHRDRAAPALALCRLIAAA